MTTDESAKRVSTPSNADFSDQAVVKREFLRCVSLETDDQREEALGRLDEQKPMIAVAVRRLFDALTSDVWAERISQFDPAVAVAEVSERSTADRGVNASDAGLQGDAGGQDIRGQTLSSHPNVVMSPTSESPVTISRSAQADLAKSQVGGRYRFDGEIARGGMGAVLKGRDTTLGRDLAVKVLLREHEGSPDTVQRFIEEAQIGGQLQHPGIAPVYDVGHLEDQRPFFTMKLIKGKTLAALLATRKSLDDDRIKMLGIFEQICQTMAYAHSRNVLHRDLKPSNIMVGAFGEVQVMDWGLAKVMTTGGIADEWREANAEAPKSLIQTIRSTGSGTTRNDDATAAGSATRMGSILGTPAYMSPEQAAGKIDRLDQRSDVFSLGAILCEILTGNPVYQADHRMDVLLKARQADTRDALHRLQESSASADLIALATECLEVDPAKRPRDADVLSQRMADHFASTDRRLRESEVEIARSKTKAEEERKRRRVVFALAACVVLAVLAGAVGWITIERAQSRLAKIQADAEIVAAADQSKLEQQIESELSAAEALGQSSGVLPSEASLLRAMEAIGRAKRMTTGKVVNRKLAERIDSLAESTASLQRDAKLLRRLSEIWEIDRQYMASKSVPSAPRQEADATLGNGLDASEDEGNEAAEKEQNVGDSLSEFARINPAGLYEQAFADWGVSLAESSLRELVERIGAFPEEQQTTITVSLDRWRDLLIEPRSLRDWQRETWTEFAPVAFPDAAPTRFEVQPGNSILARGPAKKGGYRFEFETDQQRISGLRLEALLHDSLPNNGPGRDGGGMFSLRGLKIVARPKSRPQQSLPLELVDAVTDYADFTYPFQVSHWHGWGGGGAPHVAFYRLAKPIVDPQGFHVTVSTDGSPGSWQTNERIGHFRWSSTALEDRQPDRDLLGSLLARVDDDSWRKRFRAQRDSGDLRALIDLARDVESARRQPGILIGLLTDRLMGLTGQELGAIYLDDAQWNVQTPREVHTGSDTRYEIQDGQQMVARGPLTMEQLISVNLTVPRHEQDEVWLQIRFMPPPEKPSTAIGREHLLYLRELEVVGESDPSGNNLVDLVFADYPFETPFSTMVDHRLKGWFSFRTPDRPHSVYARLNRSDVNDGESLVLRLHTGSEINRGYNPARFEVSVTTVPSSGFAPFAAVGGLLTDLWTDRPSDPIVHLQLSKYFSKRVPADRQAALSHAILACSLAPDSMAAGLHLLGLVEDRELIGNVPLQAVVAAKFRQAESQLPGNVPCAHLERSIADHAFLCYRDQRFRELRETAEMVLSVFESPSDVLRRIVGHNLTSDEDYQRLHKLLVRDCENFLRHKGDEVAMKDIHLRFGHWQFNRGFHEQAVESYRQAVRVAPDCIECRLFLGKTLSFLQDYDAAIEQGKQVLRLNPEDATGHNNLGVALFKLQRFAESADMLKQAVVLEPENAGFHRNLGLSLIRVNDFEAAALAFDRYVAKSPDASVAAAEIGSRLVNEVPLDAELLRSVNQRSKSQVASDESTEDDSKSRQRVFEIRDGIRLLKIATDLEPSSRANQRSLGLAYLRAGRWERAVEMLESAHAKSSKGNVLENRSDSIPLALAHAMLGNRNQSRNWFAQGVAWVKVNKKWDNQANRLLELAVSALKLSQSEVERLADDGFQTMVDEYSEAIREKPNDMGLIRSRGKTYFDWKKYGEAISDLSKVIEFDPEDAFPRALRAQCWKELGQYDRAIEDQTVLVQIDGHQNYRHFERAETYFLSGKYEEAVSDIARGFDVNSVDSAPWFSFTRARGLAGEIYLQHLNQPEKALDAYRLALELDPDNQEYAEGKVAALRAIADAQEASNESTD